MENTHIPHDLDKIFAALANKHRRDIIYHLGLQPHSISQLAIMRDLTLPAVHKHTAILKNANLVISKKIGRTRFLSLNREAIRLLQNWLNQYHAYWGNNQETLINYETYLKGGEKK